MGVADAVRFQGNVAARAIQAFAGDRIAAAHCLDHHAGSQRRHQRCPVFLLQSFFGSDPATVGVGIGSKGPGEPKDTRANIRANEQFVVNLVPFALAQEMRVTSIAFPRGVEEAKEAGLSLAPSQRVGVPRIAQAPVSMECTLMQEVLLGGFSLVLGRILLVHVRDEAVRDRGRQHIDANKLDLIGRMEGAWYTKTTDRFEMPPIALDDWKARTAIDAVS